MRARSNVMPKDHYAAHSGGSSVLSPSTATCRSYLLGANIGESLDITPDGSRDVAAEPYNAEEVSQARRWLADPRLLEHKPVHADGEDDQCLPPWTAAEGASKPS